LGLRTRGYGLKYPGEARLFMKKTPSQGVFFFIQRRKEVEDIWRNRIKQR
jgi:hypothetical protein